jgi:hypothetical protein
MPFGAVQDKQLLAPSVIEARAGVLENGEPRHGFADPVRKSFQELAGWPIT